MQKPNIKSDNLHCSSAFSADEITVCQEWRKTANGILSPGEKATKTIPICLTGSIYTEMHRS